MCEAQEWDKPPNRIDKNSTYPYPCRLAQMGSKTLNFIGLLRATLHPNRGAVTTCATSTGWWWHKAWHFEG